MNLNTTVVEDQESTQKEGAFDIMPNKGNEEENTTQKNGLKSVQEREEKTTQKTQQESTLKRIVELIEDNPNITIDNVAELLQMNRRGIVKHFRNLQAQGKIRRVGANKNGHWEVLEQHSQGA